MKLWVHDRRLWVEYEASKVGLENDDIAQFMIDRLPGIELHAVRADSARPETISHVKSKGRDHKRANLPRIEPVAKWQGSVEDGIGAFCAAMSKLSFTCVVPASCARPALQLQGRPPDR
ncbi:Uncharacterised protein [Pseudomonas aeruginosa]|nr:Uncharacterised protein [Pseudomonas aeruginosa]